MSKFNRRFSDDYEAEVNDRVYREELKRHRKQKRMKNALRGRKLEDLIDLDDEY